MLSLSDNFLLATNCLSAVEFFWFCLFWADCDSELLALIFHLCYTNIIDRPFFEGSVTVLMNLPLHFSDRIRSRFSGFSAWFPSGIDGILDAAERYLAMRQYVGLRSIPLYAPELAASESWLRHGKRVYLFDPHLAETLVSQTDGGALPADGLPLPAFYIHAPGAIASGIEGFFVWQESDRGTLHFLMVAGGGSATAYSFFIPDAEGEERLPDPVSWLEPYMEAALQGSDQLLRIYMSGINTGCTIHDWTLRAYQLVLYLCCDNAETEISSEEPAAGAVVNIQVGRKIGAALAATSCSSGPRKAHIRKGHWHSYWTGPRSGERVKKVRWIQPVFVGEKAKEIDLVCVSE